MSIRCQICSHPKRLEIDRQLVQGASLALVARTFVLNYNSLYVHRHRHITRQLATSYEVAQVKSDIDLLGTIDDILKKSQVIFERNFEKGRDIVALKALDGTRATIQLLSQISAQLHQAKMAEEDRLRDEQEHQAKRETTFKDQLSALSFEEACVLQRLLNKMKHQNKDVIIQDSVVTKHWLSPDRLE